MTVAKDNSAKPKDGGSTPVQPPTPAVNAVDDTEFRTATGAEVPGGIPVGVAATGAFEYGTGPIQAIVPAELLEKANFDPGLTNRIDPAGWRALLRNVWPVEALKSVHQDADKKAEVVIGQLTTRARLASALGQRHAVLMSVHPREIDQGDGVRVEGLLEPEQLKGASREVWDHCVKASVGFPDNCQPTLDFWCSQAGDWAGHNIVIHFKQSSKVADVPFEKLAEAAIEQIPLKAVMESLAGRTFSSAISFRDGDERFIEKDSSKYPPNSRRYAPGQVEPYMLKGPAKEVWDFCEKNNLHPTLEYWDTTGPDGEPISGFEIVFHWWTTADAESDELTFRNGTDATDRATA